MALLSCLTRLAERFELILRAHGVHHGLRREAAAELDLAERFAAEHDIPFARTNLTVTRGGNLQARAREARWAALREALRDATNAVIATAHHAEDRAETVLMRMLRGAGARGLAVLPPRTDESEGVGLVRPLLRALRSDVMAHLARHRVPYATDPSNADPKYLRTRVRSEVLPLLRALDPAIVSHLSAIADDLEGSATARQLSWTSGLPRATQTAIADLVRTRSREARVWLPDGLVVMAEPNRTQKQD
jgi:tRNA(Ile)-lysidine synthase